MKTLKKFLIALFTGNTRTKTISLEHKELFSNIDVSKQMHENMRKGLDSFEITDGTRRYLVTSVKIVR